MNQPHGRGIARCLNSSRTDTRWWHEHVMKKAREIRFVSGWLKFGGSANSAPFSSAVVIYQTSDKPQNIRTMVQRRELKK